MYSVLNVRVQLLVNKAYWTMEAAIDPMQVRIDTIYKRTL